MSIVFKSMAKATYCKTAPKYKKLNTYKTQIFLTRTFLRYNYLEKGMAEISLEKVYATQKGIHFNTDTLHEIKIELIKDNQNESKKDLQKKKEKLHSS